MIWIVVIFVAFFIVIFGIGVFTKNDDGLELLGLILICAGLGLMFFAGYSIGEQHGAKKQMQGGYKVEYVTDTNGIVNDTIIHTQGY